MKEFNTAESLTTRPIEPSEQERQVSMSSLSLLIEDMQREHRELFTWLTYYNHAVARGVGRNRLLAIFDATFECVEKHFRSVETLLAQSSWSRFQRHHAVHCQLTEELAAYRVRLAGDEPLDSVECAHILDATLIQFIREQPMFNQFFACRDRETAQ